MEGVQKGFELIKGHAQLIEQMQPFVDLGVDYFML